VKYFFRQVSVTLVLCFIFISAAAWAGIDYGPWLTGVTQTGVTIKWSSPETDGLVEYGTTDALGLEAATIYADGVHRTDLAGLEFGTRYYYRVTSGGDTSEIQSFLTAPGPDTPFHFGVISDTQGDISVYESIMEPLRATQPAFVLHNGDTVEAPIFEFEWAKFWSVTDLLGGQAPYFPVMGNHDWIPGGHMRFRLYWTNPLNEDTPSPSVYSFQYGNTFFISLDCDIPYREGSAQYLLLEAQLEQAKNNPSVKHCIVHGHFPPFSTANHGEDLSVLAFRRAMVPLFQKYDIDLYMSGHDHTYQRSVVNGITYLVTGCSSSRLYDCGDPAEWQVICEKTPNFSVIAIDGNQIRIQVRRPDNSVIESLTIDHNFHGDGDDDDNDAVDDDDAIDDDVSDDDASSDDDANDDDAAEDDDDDDECGC